MNRRQMLRASALSVAGLVVSKRVVASPPSVVTVYKDPSCGCCSLWVKHMSQNGFVVTVRDVLNMDEIKTTMHVPAKLHSCHTAIIDRYVVEGHVPASAIKKFLASKPKALGLAVPGMPMGSPGMEGPRVDHYDVLSFDRDGTTRVFEKH